MNKSFRLGCDIGGTFTDFVLVDDETGEFQTNKCLTSPADPSEAVEQGIRDLLDQTPSPLTTGQRKRLRSLLERDGAAKGTLPSSDPDSPPAEG